MAGDSVMRNTWPDGTVRLPAALESWLDSHFDGEKGDDAADLEQARNVTAVALWSLIYRQGDPGTDQAALDALRAGESQGAGLIAAERERQKVQEGWTAEHDDGHVNDLVLAAIAYSYEGIRPSHPMALAIWPWDEEWWKPSRDRIRNLVKAGALIAAEIDRLQRALEPDSPPTQ